MGAVHLEQFQLEQSLTMRMQLVVLGIITMFKLVLLSDQIIAPGLKSEEK